MVTETRLKKVCGIGKGGRGYRAESSTSSRLPPLTILGVAALRALRAAAATAFLALLTSLEAELTNASYERVKGGQGQRVRGGLEAEVQRPRRTASSLDAGANLEGGVGMPSNAGVVLGIVRRRNGLEERRRGVI